MSKSIHSLIAWYLLADAFSPSLSKAYQKQFANQQPRPAVHHSALPQVYINSAALCYNLVCKILITSSFNKIITLVYYIDGMMLTVPSEQKVATTLDLLIRLVYVRGWGNKSNKNSGVFYFSEITRVLVVWGMLRYPF